MERRGWLTMGPPREVRPPAAFDALLEAPIHGADGGAALEGFPLPVVLLDEHLRVVGANGAGHHLFGGRLIGRSVSELTSGAAADVVACHAAAALVCARPLSVEALCGLPGLASCAMRLTFASPRYPTSDMALVCVFEETASPARPARDAGRYGAHPTLAGR